MKLIYGDISLPYKNTAIALGDFDGVHTAHRSVFSALRKYASENGVMCGVFLFAENTKTVTQKRTVKLLTTFNEKINIISEYGIDFAVIMHFDKNMMEMQPDEFAHMLRQKLHAEAVFAGYDYKFGANASGDIKTLNRLGEKHGFMVFESKKITRDGRKISSSYIRNLVKEGNVSEAKKFLGRSYTVTGEVLHGYGNGKKIGFPTVNIGYDDDKLLPKNGVYAGFTLIGEDRCKSVINVGMNPTFEAKKTTVESYIENFSGDLYGKKITVEFRDRIRDDVKFSSAEELIKQIKNDIKKADELLFKAEV